MNQRRLALFLSLAIPVLVIFVLPPSPISPWAAARQSLESPSAFQGEKEETTLVSPALLTQSGEESGRTGEVDRQTASVTNQNTNLVGQIGGVTNAVFVQGDSAYIGEGPRLTILDISASPTPTVMSKTDPLPGIVEGLYISGTYAYVAASDAGLRVVDISIQGDPIEVGFYDTPGTARAVHVSGTYAYVADGSKGLRVIDVSNSIAPSEVGFYDPPGQVEDVYVSGSYAYLATGWSDEDLLVVDITNPHSPQYAGACDLGGTAHGVYVSGSYAYVTGNELDVIDISDPTDPQVTGFHYWGIGNSVTVSGTYAYVGQARGLWVFDISDPTDPQPEGSYDLPSSYDDVEVHVADTSVYLAAGHNGLRVVDVSDPADPHEVGSYDVLGYAHGVYVSGPYAYVAGAGEGLWIADITDPAHPQVVGAFVGGAEALSVSGSYAYVPGLGVVDISDPAHPQKVASFFDGYDIAVVPPYAYLASGNLVVVDISEPTTPTWGTSYGITGTAQGIFISGTHAYVAAYHDGLRVVDISDPLHPQEVGYYDTPGFAKGVYVHGSYAYVADSGSLPVIHGSLQVIDISNPIQPVWTGAYTTTEATDVYVSGSHAYVAALSKGLRVIDVSDPAHPQEVGFYNTAGYAVDVYASGGLIYVANGTGGLYTFSYPSESGTVSGRVTDGHNHPLPGALLALLHDGDVISQMLTDRYGAYAFNFQVNPAITYTVQVTLQHGYSPTFRVRHTPAAADCRGGSIVYAQTAPFTLTNFHYHPIDFADATLATDPAIPQNRLDDLAAIYYHTQQVIAFAQEELGVTWHLVPLEVNTFNVPAANDAWWDSDRFICIGGNVSDYVNNNGNRPMNRDWHETFHHLMHNAFGVPPLPGGDANHGGYANSSTSDSWVEGWAEVWPCILNNSHIYRWENTATNFEQNLEVWDGGGDEEFAAATLLWDLYDVISDTDHDHIDLTTEQIWEVLGDTTYAPLQDMKDVYDALVTTTITTGVTISNVNELFIAHGFYADLNNNHRHDAGEEIGRAADGARPNRRSRPPMPNAYLKVNVLDASDHPLPATLQVQVAFSGTESIYDYAYATTVPGNGELLHLWLPPTRTLATATIQAEKLGAISNPVALDNRTYWDAVAQSTTGYALEITMTVPIHLNYLPVVLKDR